MGIRIYSQMLYRNWWIILATMVIAMVVGLIANYFTEPSYTASARFIVIPSAGLATEKDVLSDLATIGQHSIVATYSEVFNSSSVFYNAVSALHFNPSEATKYKHLAEASTDANLIVLTITGPDPVRVASLANNIGEQGIQYIKELSSIYEIKLLDPARPATTPIRPRPSIITSLALLLGFIVGSGIALVKGIVKTPFEALLKHNVEDIESQAYTRNYVEKRLEEVVNQASDVITSLCFIKLDGIDTFIKIMPGTITQQVLRQTVQILRNELRGNDIVGRWNVTTFAIVLPNTSGSAAVSTLGRVQLALSRPIQFSPEGETLYLYPKIGIVEHQPSTSIYHLVDQAEKALRQALHSKTGLVLYKNKLIASI